MSMIGELMKKLRGGGEPSAASLRATLADVEARMPDAAMALDAARAERAALLLSGSDREVLAAEGRIDVARVEVDRLSAAADVLRSRLGEAEGREENARVDSLLRSADAQAARAARQFFSRYEPLAAELGGILAEVEAADEAVRAARHAALLAGKTPDLPYVEDRVAPPGRIFQPLAEISLRPAGRFAGHGPARQRAEALGLSPELANPSR